MDPANRVEADQPVAHPRDRLRRELGLSDATFLVVSSVIGAGIFFTPGRVRKHQEQIQKFVDEAWAAVADKEQADLYNEFATQVSVKVACLANGFPLEDADYCNDLVWRFFRRDPEQGEGVE